MKKQFIITVLFLLLCGTSYSADGPFSKGSAKVGGGIMFIRQSGEAYDELTKFTIFPKYTKFGSSGLFYGAAILFDYTYLPSFTKHPHLITWEIAPVLGYYFNTPKDKIDIRGKSFPFIESSVGFWRQEDVTKISFHGTAGLTYMAGNSIGIDFNFNFVYDYFRHEGDTFSGTTFLFGVGFSSFIF